ncbi:hypothetical protein L249_1331, partial [Ophiocordyceps polyrhachis-furcata BCC 54312]
SFFSPFLVLTCSPPLPVGRLEFGKKTPPRVDLRPEQAPKASLERIRYLEIQFFKQKPAKTNDIDQQRTAEGRGKKKRCDSTTVVDLSANYPSAPNHHSYTLFPLHSLFAVITYAAANYSTYSLPSTTGKTYNQLVCQYKRRHITIPVSFSTVAFDFNPSLTAGDVNSLIRPITSRSPLSSRDRHANGSIFFTRVRYSIQYPHRP